MAFRLYLFWILTWWAWLWLALGSLGQETPSWLIQTREVCFGIADNGLPDTHGWVSLAAPWPMLVTLISLCGPELRRSVESLGRPLRAALLLAPWLGFLFIAVQVWRAPAPLTAPTSGPLPIDYPRTQEEIPPFRLLNLRSQIGEPSRLKGHPTILVFAYGHCKTVCPTLLHNSVSAARVSRAPLVIIGLDPWRDNCGSWQNIAKGWELPEGAEVWTGSPEQTLVATKAFGVPCQRDPMTGEITHPGLVFLLNSQAQIAYRFNNPSSEWILQGLQRL